MPIYEYACSACGFHLEAFQKIDDQPLQICPECKKPTLEKWVSAAGFRLKGGGWYETDFKQGDKKKNLVETEKKSDSVESAGAVKEAKSESKTESSTKSENSAKTDSSTLKKTSDNAGQSKSSTEGS